jgi:hypothetical protein
MKWIDERWHVAGRGIHAGDMMELRCGDRWVLVRIESSEAGTRLFAHYTPEDPALERFTAVSEIRTPRLVAKWCEQAKRDGFDDHEVRGRAWASVDRLRWPDRSDSVGGGRL